MKFDQLVNIYLSEKKDEDGNEFVDKVAKAALAGEKTTNVGGKKVTVKMSKEKAQKIESKKPKKK